MPVFSAANGPLADSGCRGTYMPSSTFYAITAIAVLITRYLGGSGLEQPCAQYVVNVQQSERSPLFVDDDQQGYRPFAALFHHA